MSDNKVADRWGDSNFTHTLASTSWMASTAVLMHLNERATGDPARDWLSSWAHRWFVGEHLRVLVLGCGEGWLERAISSRPFVAHIEAVDLAGEAIERARAQAPRNVTYTIADLNRDSLERDAYDVVVAHMILHHVENLEHALAEIERAMKRDATFIVNEYVGPKRFQFSDDVLTKVNLLLRCLPARLRGSYEMKERPPLQLMIDLDPSEAVRSDEVLPLIEERFDVLERKNVGGTLLQHLLYDIVQNFRFDAPKERAMIELMCEYEAMLVDRRELSSDFVICAARKRGTGVTRASRPLPPRPEAAMDVDHDPLWRATIKSDLPLRVKRILVESRKLRRANLFSENPIAGALARFRPEARFDPADEDDRALLALAHAIHSIVSAR
jgi:SAM-dependent methyltransferase